MAAAKLIIFAIFLLYLGNNSASATKLNYPRVLLPIFDKISINFTLEVIEKGCFKWTSSRQDLILITPIYEDLENECSYRAKVTVLSRERRRNTAIVLAEDLSTGESLRCDVILDVIDKLGVHTTTRQLYLEEAPETFELRAEDSQGNAFTTLEGIEFNWSISSLNRDSSGWSPALRFLTFTESVYHEVPPSLEEFEAKGIKGYMVLLEGVNTGTAKVTVNIPYPEYSYVPQIEVYINILANIILEPSEVHILAGDTVHFRILQLKMGKLTEISLNDQYFLEVEDTNVASIKANSATGIKLGRTSVILRDRNVPNDKNFLTDNSIKSSIPSAQLTVANPMKLGLSLLPYNNWITVVGEKHEIALDLYTRDEQKITLGSRYSMSSELNEELFNILRRNKNGSRLFGEATREGMTPVYGAFKELTAQAELQIFSDLRLSPRKVVLPYDPNVIKLQRLQFQAHGGDGVYVWLSQNPQILQINQNGLATTLIRSDSDGRRAMAASDNYQSGSALAAHTSVRVALAKNPKIMRRADIYFLPPVKLEIVKYNFETAVGDFIRLQVAVYAFTNESFVPYTRCDNLMFDIEMANQILEFDNSAASKELAPGACQIVQLRGIAIGMTALRLSYKFQDKVLRDEVTLNVFEKLKILEPHENEVILPIGAARNIIYTNGPQRIFTLEAELMQQAQYDKQIATVSELHVETQYPMYTFNVLCRKVGKTELNLNIYNALSSSNFEPYMSNMLTTIRCVKPRFLNLYATQQLRSTCPMDVKHSLLHLKERDEKFDIEIEVQDAKNRKLMNITSLYIEWEFIAADGQQHSDSVKYQRHSEDEVVEGVRLPGKELLVSSISNISPNFRIKGTVTRYEGSVLEHFGIRPEVPHFGITHPKSGELVKPVIENEIRFMAVNSTLFADNHISIFLSKDRMERFPLAYGSGFYTFDLSEQGIVSVEYDNQRRELVLVPLRVGHVRLELSDRCLNSEPSFLSISVVTIGGIHVESPDRVERTMSIEAIVKLYDSNENLLHVDPNNLDIYALSTDVFNPDILSVKLGEQTDLQVGEIRYIITGNNLGETKIIFNSGYGEVLVSSEPLNVQVFPPLRLYPRNSTLVVGSNIQIYYHGGPQPDVNIVYRVHDKKIISMDSAIVLAHKLGVSKISGQCMMKDVRRGGEVIISEDTIEVHVVPLTNIQIRTPLTRIRSGAVMPAALWGVPDLSPMVLGTLHNIKVTWSTSQADVLDIYNIFAFAGVEYSESDLISVRIKARNPGKAKVHVTLEMPDGQKLKNAVEVIVFKMLELESPKTIKMDAVLMPPRSSIQLRANLDDVHYKLESESSGIVKVTPDGMLRSFDVLGRDLVFVKTFEQILPVNVEVKNVQYILATLAVPSLKLMQVEEKIPRGLSFALKISLHDNLGNEFSHSIEDVNGIRYALSHQDVVDVQIGKNMSVLINAMRETNNMIAISLRDSAGVKYAEDYIKLSVGDSTNIYPAKSIFAVGDIICFESPLTKASTWSSSNDKIVSIDSRSGVAKVLDHRFKLGEKIHVTNIDAHSGSFVKYDIEIREVDVLQFAKSFDIFTGATYHGYLVLRNHLQLDKFTNLIAKNASKCAMLLEHKVLENVSLFSCRLASKLPLGQQLLDNYKVTAVFDPKTGRYACKIVLITNFTKVIGIVKNHEVQMELEAHLPNGHLASSTLKLIPGIKVSPESLVAADWKDQELTIAGLDKVLQSIEVRPSHPKHVEVKTTVKAPGMVQYKVKVLNTVPNDEECHIKIHSPVTLQDINIPIGVPTAVAQKCANQPFEKSSGLLLKIASQIGMAATLLVIIVASIWLYVTCNPKRFKTEVNAEAFNTSKKSPGASVTLSPDKSTSSTLYPDISNYRQNPSRSMLGSDLSGENDSMVYGNTSFASPQRRLNRRYL